WWDDVRLHEPESTAEELKARGIELLNETATTVAPRLDNLDLGERLLGENVLSATIVNPGPPGMFRLRWEFTSPSGQKSSFESKPQPVDANGKAPAVVAYSLTEMCPTAYTEYRGRLSLLDAEGKSVASSELW